MLNEHKFVDVGLPAREAVLYEQKFVVAGLPARVTVLYEQRFVNVGLPAREACYNNRSLSLWAYLKG